MRKLLFLFYLATYFSCNTGPSGEKAKAHLGTITESVYASVTIRPEVSYFPQANRSGIIEATFVKEGDLVKKGQVLLNISTTNANRNLVDARLNLEQATANYLGDNNSLNNIRLELETLEQQLQLDSINFTRQTRLWKQNIGAKIDLDKAKIKYEASLNRFSTLQQQYAQTAQSLKNTYQKALNQLENERSTLADYSLRSEIDGKVYAVFKEVGELISPQEQFAEIGSADRFQVEMNIDEVDIMKINQGDTAVITLEAYPSKIFLAKINSIAPKKDQETQTFQVKGLFIQDPPKLYNGLSGEANIIIARRENAMMIPTGFLDTEDQVLTPNGKKKVATGLKNMEFIEIISGLDTSMILLKPKS